MIDDMDDARAALRTLMRVVGGEPSGYSVVDRCRPLLKPSDAERKLDDIRAIATEWRSGGPLNGTVSMNEICKIIDPLPTRVPQVGDTVRSVLSSRTTPRTVLDVLDDGKVLRLANGTGGLGVNVRAENWQVVKADDCKRVKL